MIEELVGPEGYQAPGIQMNQCIQKHVEHCVQFQNCKEQTLWGTVGRY